MKRLITLFACLLLTAASMSANTAYAIWCEGSKTLYFDYTTATIAVGDSYTGLEGRETVTAVWSGDDVLNTNAGRYGSGRGTYWVYPGWITAAKDLIEKVMFKESFSGASVKNTNLWFYGCSKLTSLYGLSYLNLSEATNMSYMFTDCKLLTNLDFSDANTSKVTAMDDMFSGCSSLTSLDLSNFDTSNVTDMSSMFAGCSLQTLDLSSFDTSNVTNMESMFYDCSSLQYVNLSSFNTSNVTSMYGMFEKCSQLSSLDLSSFNVSEVTTFKAMFSGCSNLSVIYCDSDWYNDSSVKGDGGTNTFSGCTSLKGAVSFDSNSTSVSMANPTTGYFTSLEQMARDMAKVIITENGKMFFVATSETVNKNDVYEGSLVKHVFSGDQILNTTNYPDWIYTTVEVTDVIIDESFRNVHPASTAFWFVSYREYVDYSTNKIKSIQGLENLNVDKVETMWGMFRNSYVTELDLSNFDTGNVQQMLYMFDGCKELTTVNLSSFNTSKVTDMKGMFLGCSSLTSLDLSNFDTSKVTTMYSMFRGCTSLTSLDLSNFNTSSVTDMSYMFNYCSGITELDLSNFDTSKVVSMEAMFENCSSLSTIYCNDTWSANSSWGMFRDCSSLSGAAFYNASKVDVSMANPDTGYFTRVQTYELWVGGKQVTASSAKNLTVLPGVSKIADDSYAFYDPDTGTLKVKGVIIEGTDDAYSLRSRIDGLTIQMEGAGEENFALYAFGKSTQPGALLFEKSTTITGEGILAVLFNINDGVRFLSDLTINDITAAIASSNTYALNGNNAGTLHLTGKANVTAVGANGAVYGLKGLDLGKDIYIKSPAGAQFQNGNVCLDGEIVKGFDEENWVVIAYDALGDVNEDGKVDINDVVCIINHMAGNANWPRANVNGDGTYNRVTNQFESIVDINDVVAVINIMAGK